MPVETTVTRCGNCGATLDRRSGQPTLQCAYCEQVTYLAPTQTVTASLDDNPAPTQHGLLRGPSGRTFGAAQRFSPAAMATRDVAAHERGLWPSHATASSTYGGSWSPSAVIGPPRVYPRCGDIGGAWAPGPAHSPVEWIELTYNADVPVAAVRVFETNRPGATFAVVDLTHGEELLYEAPPQSLGDAQVLEVAVNPPRPIRRLRVYVANSGWAEIDTVGLLAAAPLPEALRTRAKVSARRGCAPVAATALGMIVVLALAIAVVALVTENPHGARRRPNRPSQAVSGATFHYATPSPAELAGRGIVWASGVRGFSSEYSSSANAASAVLGAPDVYPRYGDIREAWAPRATDGGEEWIEVRFPYVVNAGSVVWVETLHPGAVRRVDDITEGSPPTVLWEGTASGAEGTSAVAEVTLPSARSIVAVRLVLDTRRVRGWNEVDAIGLAEAR
ncbi:MAG: hypothetical protein R3A52_08100 [Polyangiales bacterium]